MVINEWSSMVINGQWPMANAMVNNGQTIDGNQLSSMVNDRWSMINGQ